MWRKLPAGLAGLVLVLTLGAAAAPPGLPLLVSGDVRQVAAPGGSVPAVAAAITRLGYDMRTEGNFVASPLSVAYGYAMVRAGAGGRTADALDELFGVPPDDLHRAMNFIGAQVTRRDVTMANGLFVRPEARIGAPFLRTLATQYGSGVHPVDLGSERGAALINRWVSDRTGGRIPKIYDARSGGVAVLVNTIHLDADWADPFGAPTPTAPAPFTRPDGTSVSVPTMRRDGAVPYAQGVGWQAAELAYRGTDLVMRVLLPDVGRDPGELLEPGRLTEIGAALQTQPISLQLPKWEFRQEFDLRRLGPDELYTAADLRGIAPGLQISAAEHAAWISVDEQGTEAAGATSLTMTVSGLAPPAIELRADHPFAFVILHKPTGVPLFVGQVTDPS